VYGPPRFGQDGNVNQRWYRSGEATSVLGVSALDENETVLSVLDEKIAEIDLLQRKFDEKHSNRKKTTKEALLYFEKLSKKRELLERRRGDLANDGNASITGEDK